MIPLSADVPMQRIPWANWVLIAATVIVSLSVPYKRETIEYRNLIPELGDEYRVRVITHTEYSPLVLQPDNFEVYQLVTALFQHAGLLHLFGNMLFLFVFGNPINAKLGHLPFVLAYLGIGAIESAIWLVVGTREPCLGASAAIMGVWDVPGPLSAQRSHCVGRAVVVGATGLAGAERLGGRTHLRGV